MWANSSWRARQEVSHPTLWLNQVWASRPCRQSSHPICSPWRNTNLPKLLYRCWSDSRNDYTNRRTWWSTDQESLETSNLLHSGRTYHESSWTIQRWSETGSSPSFPWARKEEEMPSSLPGSTSSLLSLRGFMWWSAWKWSQGSTTTLQVASPRNQESCNLPHKVQLPTFGNTLKYLPSSLPGNATSACEILK